MAEPRRPYRPPKPRELHVRESVRRALLALVDGNPADAKLEVALVADVERSLRCELPDEILACFANGDDILPEWGFKLAAVAEHTALAREMGARGNLVAVGQDPAGTVLLCIERRGDRKRAVGLVEFQMEANGDVGWRDLGAWLTELTGLDEAPPPPHMPGFVQLTFWEDVQPKPREFCLVE